MKKPPIYVSFVGDRIFVNFCEHGGVLQRLGFVKDLIEAPELQRYTKSAPVANQDLGLNLMALRDANIAFAEGKDWSPASIVEKLIEERLFIGDFQRIRFVNANKPLEGWTFIGKSS